VSFLTLFSKSFSNIFEGKGSRLMGRYEDISLAGFPGLGKY
jgi:hypothetical protein